MNQKNSSYKRQEYKLKNYKIYMNKMSNLGY